MYAEKMAITENVMADTQVKDGYYSFNQVQ